MHCLCYFDLGLKIEKRNYPQVYLEECTYKKKRAKMIKFIDAELKLESDSKSESESKSDTELMT